MGQQEIRGLGEPATTSVMPTISAPTTSATTTSLPMPSDI